MPYCHNVVSLNENANNQTSLHHPGRVEVVQRPEVKHVVAVSKHLCGSATGEKLYTGSLIYIHCKHIEVTVFHVFIAKTELQLTFYFCCC